jgi:hypothetical protein
MRATIARPRRLAWTAAVLLAAATLPLDAAATRADGDSLTVEVRGQVTISQGASQRTVKTADVARVDLALTERVCLDTGAATVTYTHGGAVQSRTLAQRDDCFQLAPRRSLRQSLTRLLTGFISSLDAIPFPAMSRGGPCAEACAPLGLALPEDYALPDLQFPASGRPNPKTLVLEDASGAVIFRERSSDDQATFSIPIAALRAARGVAVLDGRNGRLFAGPVRQVRLETAEAGSGDPSQEAGRLLALGALDFGPAIYSYLRAAGRHEEAGQLEARLRALYRGQ